MGKHKVDYFLLVLVRDDLGDSLELHVVGAFVNRSDLCITVELFNTQFTSETNTTTPFDSLAGSLFSNLRSIKLGHSSFLDKVTSFFLETSSIVCQQASSFNFNGNYIPSHQYIIIPCILDQLTLSILMLHALEITNVGVELLALEEIRQSNIISTLSETNHLGSDTNTTFIQDFNSILVSLANFTKNVLLGNLDIIKVEDTSG